MPSLCSYLIHQALLFEFVERAYNLISWYVNTANAIAIGLFPDLPISKIAYVGNTSIWGAKLAAFSREARELLRQITSRTTYYDLMGTDDYVEQFRQAMFLPHTDIELFPSLAKGGKT